MHRNRFSIFLFFVLLSCDLETEQKDRTKPKILRIEVENKDDGQGNIGMKNQVEEGDSIIITFSETMNTNDLGTLLDVEFATSAENALYPIVVKKVGNNKTKKAVNNKIKDFILSTSVHPNMNNKASDVVATFAMSIPAFPLSQSGKVVFQNSTVEWLFDIILIITLQGSAPKPLDLSSANMADGKIGAGIKDLAGNIGNVKQLPVIPVVGNDKEGNKLSIF